MSSPQAFININGVEVPNTPANRTAWARHAMLNHPEDTQIDEDGLLWADGNDGFWYSIQGNRSKYSPAQKVVLNERREAEQAPMIHSAEYWYDQVMYQSRIRLAVLDRDGRTCQICGKHGPSKLHVHHILKRRMGGTDHLDNLITVCPQCHGRADSTLYDPEWINPRLATGGERITHSTPGHTWALEDTF